MLKNNYLSQIRTLLAEIESTEANTMSDAAEIVADAVADDRLIWVFGSSHAGILAEEMYYRAGGLACISPIFLPGLAMETRPATWSSILERQNDYAMSLIKEVSIAEGDVLIVHSVSGRNTAPVEVALYGKQKGAKVIALTSLEYAAVSKPRSKTGRLLHESADVVLDNHAPPGDAVVDIPGAAHRVSPASTVLSVAIMHTIMAEAALRLTQRGVPPPVFISANLDEGDQHNRQLLERYRGRVMYL